MKLNLSHKYHRLLEGGKMCGAGLSLGVAFFLRVRWSHAEDFRKGGRAPAAAVGGVAWTTTRRDVLFDVVGGQRRCGVEEAGLLVVAGGEEEVVSGVEDAEVEGEDGVGVAGEVVKESAGARVEVSEAGRVGEGDDEAEVVPLEVDDGAGVDGGEADDGFGVVEDRDGAGVVAGGEPRRGTAERNRSGDAVRGQGQLRDDFLRFQMEHRHGRAVQGGRDDVRAVRVTRKSLLRQVDDGPVVAGELRVDVPAGALLGAQWRTVPSALPESMELPSLAKKPQLTGPSWPAKTRRHSPVRACHSHTVPSWLPAASTSPRGWNSSHSTSPGPSSVWMSDASSVDHTRTLPS
mmetsp:Transcript_19266/g.59443  ORF Transcript_19266/g.59443 Transcript_19266/m.59443 type:complete len:347 (+) Transcript_19266:1305-2345(+)